MGQLTDAEIRQDIINTLRMWERFNALKEEQQNSLIEYLFDAYGHLYREDNLRIDISSNQGTN